MSVKEAGEWLRELLLRTQFV